MKSNSTVVGWREWIGLPDLGINVIKAKVDTGARTSALHVEDLRTTRRGNKRWVKFTIYPLQRSRKKSVRASALLVDERSIRSSSGHREMRPVIETQLAMAGGLWLVEITLTSRNDMGFRMLLGRQAVRGHGIVDPSRSFLTRKIKTTTHRRQKS